ncbi:MAG TPA: hypothetical protein VIN58_06855 [Roseateles sp.]
MRIVPDFLLAGLLAAAAASAAFAQSSPPASAPPASAAVPVTAASRIVPTRNAAVTAAENAKEPGAQRPEEKVIPQISLPLRTRPEKAVAAAASGPSTGAGALNDGAARCLATANTAEKAACERGVSASAPAKPR